MSELKRNLGFYTVLAIVIGDVIGSGIFLKPATMSQQFPSVTGILLLWIVAGVITLMGALTNAEAAGMYPETGGQYVFFKKMYGSFIAFLYGWSSVVVFNTAGIASIAYVASYYLDYLYPLYRFDDSVEKSYAIHIPGVGTFFILEYIGRKLVTICILLLFTIVNCFSVNQSSWVQRFLTGLKIGSVLLAVFLIFIYATENHLSLSFHYDSKPPVLGWPGFVAALAGAFWCYDGWNNVTFVAGEIKQPEKVISKSLWTGLLICTMIYFLFNLALFYVLPFETIQGSPFVAASALDHVFGSAGGFAMSAIVIVSVLGAVNGNILSCSRVTYSFAKDHSILSKIGEIHPKYKTPFYAIIANTVWSMVLIMSGSFDQLTDILIFVSWVFYGLSAVGVIILRIRNPSQPRPYKVPGYPLVPLIFILFTFFYLGTTVYSDVYAYHQGVQPVVKCFVGGILVFLGLPLYFYSSRKNRVAQQ